MRSASLWARLLGLSKVVVEGVEFDEIEQAVVVSVRPRIGDDIITGLTRPTDLRLWRTLAEHSRYVRAALRC